MEPSVAGMLSPCYCAMEPETFTSLPTSTNAVESHNRFSKSDHPEILKIALLSAYKEDIAKCLSVLASQQQLQTVYEDLTPSGRLKRAKKQSKARRKRLADSQENDAFGPPDTNSTFEGRNT